MRSRLRGASRRENCVVPDVKVRGKDVLGKILRESSPSSLPASVGWKSLAATWQGVDAAVAARGVDAAVAARSVEAAVAARGIEAAVPAGQRTPDTGSFVKRASGPVSSSLGTARQGVGWWRSWWEAPTHDPGSFVKRAGGSHAGGPRGEWG